MFQINKENLLVVPCDKLVAPMALLAVLSGADAGVVGTAVRRMEGKVALRDKHVQVGRRSVPWSDVLYVALNENVRPLPSPNALRLRSGEVWSVEAFGAAAGKITLRIDPLGRHQIDAAQAEAIDFAANLPRPAKLEPQTLYRQGRQPVPGALLWFDTKRIAIDSPFGPITLNREGTLRYVFPAGAAGGAKGPKGPKGPQDEVVLTNGTALRGSVSGSVNGVKLKHRLLGEVALPAAALRSVVKRNAAATFLTDLKPQVVQASGLLGGSARSPAVKILSWPDAAADGPFFVKALHIEPRTVLKYGFPKRGAGRMHLRALLLPARGSKGDTLVRIASSGRDILRRELKAEAKPVIVAAQLAPEDTLTIEVTFGERLGMPCGAVLVDPVLGFVPAGGAAAAAGQPAEATD